MNDLTKVELDRIIFLHKCGVDGEEVISSINKKREADEEKRANDVDYYIFCVLDKGDIEDKTD